MSILKGDYLLETLNKTNKIKILKLLICMAFLGMCGCALLPFSSFALFPPTQLVASAAILGGVDTEYWISTNATGNVLGFSTNNPLNTLDGSNETNFDRNMNDLPANFTIHLMPGTFHTRGNVAWNANPGIKILGSGMDSTIIQFSSNTVASFKGATWHNFITEKSQFGDSNTVVRDLTLDCNYQPGIRTTLNGIGLFGSGNLVSHVKFLNGASFSKSQTNYAECMGVLITGWAGPASNNVIEYCVVSGYTCNFFNNMSALGLNGVNYNGRLSHNLIIQTGATNYVYGLGCIGNGFVVDGNVTSNCVIAYHSDTPGGTTNMEFVNNSVYDCCSAVYVANSVNVNFTMASNTIVLGNFTPGYTVGGLLLDGSSSFTNTVVFQNRISFDTFNPLYVPRFVYGDNATGLVIQYNTVEYGIANQLANCSGLLINSNVDFNGNPSFINTTNTTAK
jgi:hypothetical protein